MNKDQLEDFVNKASLNDPRFFTKSFEINDIKKFRGQVIEYLKYPPVNQKWLYRCLRILKILKIIFWENCPFRQN